MGMPLRREAPRTLSLSLVNHSQLGFVTLDKFSQKLDGSFVSDSFGQYGDKGFVVDIIEEFSYVTLQHITGHFVILTFFPKHCADRSYSFVVSFSNSTGKRMWNKGRLKQGIQNAKYSMVEYSVAYRRFMYMSPLRIGDKESCIWPVPVRSVSQLAVKLEKIRLQVWLEFFHIRASPFTFLEFVPCRKQIFQGGYIIKKISINSHCYE